MRTRLAVAGAATGAALVLGAAGALALPALADESPGTTAERSDTRREADRRAAIRSALDGLVRKGTLTQQQADAVAGELAGSSALRGPGRGPLGGGPRGFGPGGDEVATAAAAALGLEADELRDRLRDGATLKSVAEGQGKSLDTVVNAIVAAVEKRLAAEVAAGRLTRARADEIRSTLRERVRAMAERTGPARGEGWGEGRGGWHRHGDGGPGAPGGDGGRGGPGGATPTPTATGTPSS